MSEPGDLQYLELYARFSEELRTIADGKYPASRASGFSNSREEAVEVAGWQPVGTLPDRFVDRKALNKSASFQLIGRLGCLGIRDGGFTQNWERRVFANTEQRLTVILNGRAAVDVSYFYDGREGWSYAPVRLPASLPADDLEAVEIENNGRLLLSEWVSKRVAVSDYDAKIGFVSTDGVVVGAATAGPESEEEVLVELTVDGVAVHAMTEGAFFAEPFRRFACDVSAFCRDGGLTKVSLKNLVTGAEGRRSPLGVFRSQEKYFFVANPRVRDGQYRLTLRMHKPGANNSLSLAAHDGTALQILCEVDQPDEEDFSFLGRTNSFQLPVAAMKGARILIVDENSEVVGELPPIDELLSVMGGEG